MACLQGADSKISGLIAMLIAAQLLKKGGSQATFTHRIVFAALDGESWGYMGSKRMIWELSEGKEFSGNTIPLSLADVEKVYGAACSKLFFGFLRLCSLLKCRAAHRTTDCILQMYILS